MKMNIAKSSELLRTRADFMCLLSVLGEARRSDLTGFIQVDWDSSDERLKRWVGGEILPAEVLENSTGYLMLQDGAVVGARVGSEASADFEKSLDSLVRLCFGFGCGILSSTVLTLAEAEVAQTDVVGRFSVSDLRVRIDAIERAATLAGNESFFKSPGR